MPRIKKTESKQAREKRLNAAKQARADKRAASKLAAEQAAVEQAKQAAAAAVKHGYKPNSREHTTNGYTGKQAGDELGKRLATKNDVMEWMQARFAAETPTTVQMLCAEFAAIPATVQRIIGSSLCKRYWAIAGLPGDPDCRKPNADVGLPSYMGFGKEAIENFGQIEINVLRPFAAKSKLRG